MLSSFENQRRLVWEQTFDFVRVGVYSDKQPERSSGDEKLAAGREDKLSSRQPVRDFWTN